MAQVDTPNRVDTDQEQLSSQEQELLTATLERGFEDTRDSDTETVLEKVEEYMEEIQVGARIARAQFDQKFGGLNPTESRFAMSRIHSGYFGWDSWEGLGSLSSGQTNAWIDAGTPDNLSGSTGLANPLKVGEEAVHVILGFGTYHDSPKVSTVDWELNESPRTTIKTKWEWTRTDVAVKWLDSAIILPENSLFAAEVYADNGGDDFPYLFGVSFLENRASQIADPSNMTDDTTNTNDNIVAQG